MEGSEVVGSLAVVTMVEAQCSSRAASAVSQIVRREVRMAVMEGSERTWKWR